MLYSYYNLPYPYCYYNLTAALPLSYLYFYYYYYYYYHCDKCHTFPNTIIISIDPSLSSTLSACVIMDTINFRQI